MIATMIRVIAYRIWRSCNYRRAARGARRRKEGPQGLILRRAFPHPCGALRGQRGGNSATVILIIPIIIPWVHF